MGVWRVFWLGVYLKRFIFHAEDEVTLGFVHLSPSIFPIDPKMRLKCAANQCEKSVLFCDAVIFNWVDRQKFSNAAFCSYACALSSVLTTNMPRA